MKTTKTGYNYRTRKEREIIAIIMDANGAALDAIDPGTGNHRTALDWAEWRAASIPTDYPGAVRMVVYCGDDEIATIDLDQPEPTGTTAPTEPTAPESVELSAAKCLTMYLDNTREIYNRYTVPAIDKVAAMMRSNATHPQQFDTTPTGVARLHEVRRALSVAAGLVRKCDHLTPTRADIEQAAHDYAAYIVECAQYENANA